MKTYNSIPKKYNDIEPGAIKVIGNYVYAVKSAYRTGQRSYVFRMTVDEYNQMREQAENWIIYKANPTEKNLQQQIAYWLVDESETEPYIRTTPCW